MRTDEARGPAAWLEREPALVALGLAGILLGLVCVTAGAVLGWSVPPEVDLRDTAAFDIGIGIYVLTRAAFLPATGFWKRERRLWRWAAGAALALRGEVHGQPEV